VKRLEEVEPTFTVHRDRGIWIPVITYALWDGRPERHEDKACFTRWGAERVGRRKCAEIVADRQRPFAVAIRRCNELMQAVLDTERRGQNAGALRAELREAVEALDEVRP
jgi:hypothetical protein